MKLHRSQSVDVELSPSNISNAKAVSFDNIPITISQDPANQDESDDVGNQIYGSIIFNELGQERGPWLLFGHQMPRSLFMFTVQIVILFIVDTYCMFKLMLNDISCEEKTIYFTLLTSSLTYLLPNPTPTKVLEEDTVVDHPKLLDNNVQSDTN